MKAALMTMILIAGTWGCAVAEMTPAEVTREQLESFIPPEGIDATVTERDGAPVIALTNTNTDPISVTLVALPMGGIENTQIVYTASMSSTDMVGSAYLELYAVIGGAAYFSRALNDPFTGTTPMRETSAPFFLQAGQPMEAARLGVRFEGPGTVLLSHLRLVDTGLKPGMAGDGQRLAAHAGKLGQNVGGWAGIAGAALGTFTSLWACLALYLALKGRGRTAVLGFTMAVAIAGVAVLIGGLWAWTEAAVWALWYPLVLLGSIAAINYAIGYLVLRYCYGRAEERRMHALDLQ